MSRSNHLPYLVQLITDDGKSEGEIISRIGLAKNAFSKRYKHLTNKNISFRTRLRQTKCYVFSLLTYACYTCTLSKQNYKAEAAAIEEAVALLHTPKSYNKNIVLLSDAKSVLQALHNLRNRAHSNLKASLLQLGLSAQQIVLQWLPGHCNIWGNTRADQLAKEGSQLEQLDGGSSYAESKTLVKAAMARKWKSDHPDSDPSDPIHGMTRISQQTIIFRLRTVHNRLRQHMYKRFRVGDSEICPCGQAPQNTQHVLQACSSHKQLRARTWPNQTPLEKKLYGTTEELALTVEN